MVAGAVTTMATVLSAMATMAPMEPTTVGDHGVNLVPGLPVLGPTGGVDLPALLRHGVAGLAVLGLPTLLGLPGLVARLLLLLPLPSLPLFRVLPLPAFPMVFRSLLLLRVRQPQAQELLLQPVLPQVLQTI